MNLILASTGSYPRIGDSAELQILRRTIAAADRGEKTAADLADAENFMTRRAIEEQARAGLDLITDGQVRWYDPISHIAGKLSGVKINGLLRFFDTNSYFRQPVLTARPERRSPVLAGEFLFACNALGALSTPAGKAGKLKVKAVMTGPYTLAKSSLVENPAMSALEARVDAYASALAAELQGLAEAGAEHVQVDEPAILKHPEDWPVFVRGLGPILRSRDTVKQKGRKLEVSLYVYFQDAAPLYEKLVALPVDALGVDFTYNPKLVDLAAAAGSPRPLGLGLVDGRNTRLEDAQAVARQVAKILPKISGGCGYLGTSSGLEYLPRDRAQAKLELLGKVRAIVAGVAS
jgi:5-methyltetrahydropteroyltriglutamate--homocysteine methyltransferase